ncbi:hydroxymethylpyrimidine/phosphomethylpyrimidine kinase [Varunaivibrio sulfuroxidans]|uniref:hydroxymethylpyrimidine kinase n=2 Tax=Varunaivibrio sulfuroxidans TaxID=1773489 RepID=A0A4R3JAX4_9PROT|nr:hydroxymethylpyrimidine/phosphomethylpyrimidine kinase [Varunaivibrio sulfuroxidans]WES32178.1 bifunctional hydroxymethylpyrimidine kinase/phosphomethylpyrimidine kinase [Varunaivibrio sulfuroxidans]
MTRTQGRVLIIAGSDSGGGAGVQGDIKTVTCLGGYAMTAISALTAQNTRGVRAIFDIPAAFVGEQMRACLEDIGADAVKIGMLHKKETIDVVCDILAETCPRTPLVVDPVMVAKGGQSLLDPEALATLKSRLLPRATVLTPNIPEAEALSGIAIGGDSDLAAAALILEKQGAKAVLIKGGHRDVDPVVDVLWSGGRVAATFSGARIDTPHTHGTGCALASAIACSLAQGMTLEDAAERAHAYVRGAIESAPGLGRGHGPLNHGHPCAPFDA